MPLAREWFVIAFGCGVEGKDLGMKPSGQEDKGQGSSFEAYRPSSYHSSMGKTGVKSQPGKGSPSQRASGKGCPVSDSSTLGLPIPMSFLIAKSGWEQLTAPLAKRASQLLEAAA